MTHEKNAAMLGCHCPLELAQETNQNDSNLLDLEMSAAQDFDLPPYPRTQEPDFYHRHSLAFLVRLVYLMSFIVRRLTFITNSRSQMP